MDKKFNVGDRVRSKFYGIVGSVIDVDTDGYIINPDHAEEMWIAEDDAEAYDRKTAFLSELKELMSKYHAHFEVDFATQATYLIVGKERYPYLVPNYIEKE